MHRVFNIIIIVIIFVISIIAVISSLLPRVIKIIDIMIAIIIIFVITKPTPVQGDQDRGAEESEVVGGGDGACQPDGQTQRETRSTATGLITILYFGFADLFYKLLTYCSAINMNSGQVTDKLQALNDEFAAMTKKKKDLEDNIDLCSQKLDRS